ncbi:hypothetical protein R1sor_007292 [Riccia sorocarpa]|uniref:NPF family transporter n=1 Tax=Riccia sorocarpa TaxID=122646 RepID=A0ABD3HU69_9MARC
MTGDFKNDGYQSVKYRPLRSDSGAAFMNAPGDEEKTMDGWGDQQTFLVGNGSLDRKGRLADRTKTGGWKAGPPIFGTELCERIGSLGLQRNLVTYFTTKMHLSNPVAANMVSNFTGALYLTPFLGGFVADAYLGRFWVIIIFGVVQVCGMILLTLSASLPDLRPGPCPARGHCSPAHGWQLGVLYIGIYLIAVGNGGIKPNISSLGADQFDETDAHERKQVSHFFNWFYICVSIGSLISVTVIVYLEDNIGFGWGFGIPTAIFAAALTLFVAGAPLYRFKATTGSPLTSVCQVLVAAFRNRKLPLPEDERLLYEIPETAAGYYNPQRIAHSNQFLLLDKAAIATERTEPKSYTLPADVDSWRLCTVTQVEELKMIISLLPIWAGTCFVWTALTQLETFSVEAAATLDRSMGSHFKFPPASLAVFELVNVLLILPLYDLFFVPFMRRFTGHPQGISTLQRIGVGIVVSVLAMIVAALVEVKRVNVAKEHGLLDKPKAVIPMTIFWLVPQYFLRGTTEIFTQVGQLDFFYSEAPESMRSLGTALYLSTIGVGHFLSSLLVTAVRNVTRHGDDAGWLRDNLNRSRLDKFYYLLAIMSAVNFLFYLLCAHWYRYKKVVHVGLSTPAREVHPRN